MAELAVADDRFAMATVRTVLHRLAGLEPLDASRTGDDPVLTEAFRAQRAFVVEVARVFQEENYNFKVVVEEVVLSHYFRAVAQDGASEGTLLHAGTAHLLTPEELDRKIEAVLGTAWADDRDRRPLLRDYRLLYGGIDSDTLVRRLTDPNGIMGAIGLRMATVMSCAAVPRDFVLPPEQRRLFPMVERAYEPETPEGFAIPEVEQRIRQTISHLHWRLLGDDLPIGHEEIDATFNLWRDTWREGREAVANGEVGVDLPGNCRADDDEIPEDRRVRRDERYTVRAWMAVLTYLLSDYQMLHE
jgi:hypothetical protein